VEVLLLVWRGDIGPARERLVAAAVDVPIAVPFAGLGVVLARRLDLAVLGELGPFSRALTAVLPRRAGLDILLDRGIASFLAGAFDDAASSVRLWVDSGAPQTSMAVPGLDEVVLVEEARSITTGPVQPPEVALAHDLRVRIAAAGDGSWTSERDDVHETARTLRSPFARARVENMLGIQHAIRDDPVVARVHFQYAERLFEAAGATAWARSTRDRLDRLDETAQGVVRVTGQLGSCRSAWAQVLTARELEVALRAVKGEANRDIASGLTVSIRTVEVHLGRAFAKLGVRNRVELTVLAHRAERHL
jgi:DNA-binding CsgD family transcriptional regulator